MEDKIPILTMPSELQLQEAQITKMNLFFIKSKHAFRQFKNHDYFEHSRYHNIERKELKPRQFVNSPAPYGINNAYAYVCTEISKNMLTKSHYSQHRTKICSVKEVTKTKNQSFMESCQRKTSYLLPNLSSEARRIQTISHNSSAPFPTQYISHTKPQQTITFQYIFQTVSSAFSTFELKFNIYPYIQNTFLKSKVSYQEMTQLQYKQLKGYIQSIYNTQKQYVEYKDMVNMSSMRQIFNELQSSQREIGYKMEMVRYFFVANQQIYRYQLDKMKDELKRIVGHHFNKDIGHQDLQIVSLQDGTTIQSLFMLMKNQGKYLISIEKEIIMQYRTYLHQKDVQSQLANRIKKWKSIAPSQSSKSSSFKTMPDDRYQKLFRTVQKRRDKWTRNKKKEGLALKSSQFIDRQKLNKDKTIFQ